jgi:ATP-dependent helicase/nuclease subunit A
MTVPPLECNRLIEAGAGTGKTTRLVKAVLQALFIRQIPLDAMVALTFTNKAAAELKERVAQAINDILSAASIDTLRQQPWWPSPEPMLALSDLQNLAGAAAAVLDRADISTIHSFAYSLLKRFPLAAGIDPEAEIDDKGLRSDGLFRKEWPAWLSVELGTTAPREGLWMELIRQLTLSEIEETARLLADFQAPLEKLPISDQDLSERLKPLAARIHDLVQTHHGNRKADDIARACEEVIRAAAQNDWDKIETLSEESIQDLAKDSGDPTQAWTREELDSLEYLQSVARNLRARGDRVIARLTESLAPFVAAFRQRLLAEGCLTHSALLYLSRDIIKNHPEVRAALKRDIRLILIDEFQDTDPLQSELLLYLAEKSGTLAASWEDVELEPGKLFIVGDPKQSIYRFRGADIAAYQRIGQHVLEQGGIQEILEVNYRSQSQIIHLVNAAFEKIIQPVEGISPPYVAILPHHPHDLQRPVQDVQIWLADSPEPQTVEEAQTTEAEHIARWIAGSCARLMIHDPREGLRPLRYRDIALIFRTYSPMDRTIEALRRHQIPFAVESERYFFTTPEVTDFLNFLQAAANPEDLLSLIGFLRGPLAGMTDSDILRARRQGTLEQQAPVRWLRSFTPRLARQPLGEVLRDLFENSFLLELAARSYHGDQTVANLLKLRRLLEELAGEGLTTMSLLLRKLEEFFTDDTIEGENPLADETYNAVRLLTIHKAKGLEFPVVFLPSLQSELRAHRPDPFVFDWRSQRLGIQAGNFCNLDKLEMDQQTRQREAAEENRILYVAMTRARERLVLSGGIHPKAGRGQTYLRRLVEAWGQSLADLDEGQIPLGDTALTIRRLKRVQVTHPARKKEVESPLLKIDPDSFAKIWQKRNQRYRTELETPRLLTPTGDAVRGTWYEDYDEGGEAVRTTYHVPRTASLMLGDLIHRFLEHWDFDSEKCSMPARLRVIANSYFAGLGLLRTPFPDPKEGMPTFDEQDPMSKLADIVEEAQRILAAFVDSEAYDEIKQSHVLGREIPFCHALPNDAMMRGTMDILFQATDGELVVGDYKTDRLRKGETPQSHARRFAPQAAAYVAAVEKALGKRPQFKLIYLREGVAVALPTAARSYEVVS